MKKILYYLSTFPTFSQNFITREIEALAKTGRFDIVVLSLQKGEKGIVPEVLKDKVVYFSRPKLLRILDSLVFVTLRPLLSLRLISKYSTRFPSLVTAISMLPVVRKLKPDIIHANWITEGALISNMLSDLTGTHFSIECHAEDIWLSPKEMLIERVGDAKFVITCTQNNLNYLTSVLPDDLAVKVSTVYHHIDANLFKGKVASFNDTPVIYLIGRMVEKKGYTYMIRAAKILRDKGLNFQVRFAGRNGPEKERLIQLTSQFDLSDKIKFLDEVSFEEHSHNYLESDIFVAPSIKSTDGNMDGVPNVIIEAMLAGLPIVATRLSAIPEVVIDGETGYLVDEKDEKALADKIEDLLKDKEKRLRFGANGKKKIIEMFSFDNTIQKIIFLFEKE